MGLQSLNHLLDGWESRPQVRSQRDFQRLLDLWPGTVGATVAQHTEPISIHRSILQVATSSPVWAQTLTFERLKILAKLNAQLSQPLADIRFSAGYGGSRPAPSIRSGGQSPQQHPSYAPPLAPDPDPNRHPQSGDPRRADQAFQHWASLIQRQMGQQPLCPHCQCPTPTGELKRWSMCAICAAKGWSHLISNRRPD